MIDLIKLKENLDEFKNKLELRGYVGNLDEIINKNDRKNSIQVKLDELKNSKNTIFTKVGKKKILQIQGFHQIYHDKNILHANS